MKNYEVYYTARWTKIVKFCGNFPTLELASEHVDYLGSKLPNGRKIAFRIVG